MAVACALALVASTDQLHGRLVEFFARAEAFIHRQPELGLLVFLAFAATSAMLAFVSSAVIVPVGILVWGQTATALLLWAGWILGGAGSYALSRYVGRPVVRKLTTGQALARYESRLSERTPFAVVVLFQMAVPSELPGYLLGMVRYRFWKYALALAIAEAPYAVATVYLGTSFMEQRTVPLIAMGVAGAAFGAWAIRTLHRRFTPKSGPPAGTSGARGSYTIGEGHE
jgi:uncharacterized membrane protein YdjX (TVP38/TMEM64 family)